MPPTALKTLDAKTCAPPSRAACPDSDDAGGAPHRSRETGHHGQAVHDLSGRSTATGPTRWQARSSSTTAPRTAAARRYASSASLRPASSTCAYLCSLGARARLAQSIDGTPHTGSLAEMKPAGPTRLIAGAHRPGLFVRADTFPRRRALPAGPQYHADPLGKSLDARRAGIDATLTSRTRRPRHARNTRRQPAADRHGGHARPRRRIARTVLLLAACRDLPRATSCARYRRPR